MFKGGNNLTHRPPFLFPRNDEYTRKDLIPGISFKSKTTRIQFLFRDNLFNVYDQEKVNNYEVRSVISINDISLMIVTVLFEGGTTWDGECIHILMVGLC